MTSVQHNDLDAYNTIIQEIEHLIKYNKILDEKIADICYQQYKGEAVVPKGIIITHDDPGQSGKNC